MSISSCAAVTSEHEVKFSPMVLIPGGTFRTPKVCCIPNSPRGGGEEGSYDPRTTNVKIPRKVLKGGSHFCAPNYCRCYRPAARHAPPVDISTSLIGFRCVRREAPEAP